MNIFDEAAVVAVERAEQDKLPSRSEVLFGYAAGKIRALAPHIQTIHERLVASGAEPQTVILAPGLITVGRVFKSQAVGNVAVGKGWTIARFVNTSNMQGSKYGEIIPGGTAGSLVLGENGDIHEQMTGKKYDLETGLPPSFVYPKPTGSLSYSPDLRCPADIVETLQAEGYEWRTHDPSSFEFMQQSLKAVGFATHLESELVDFVVAMGIGNTEPQSRAVPI